MNLLTIPYQQREENLPQQGRYIIGQYDDRSIVVYQAYKSTIGHFAAKNGYFGGEFSFDRMTWIKPSFLWMMYRSNWGTSAGQEVILAIRLQLSAFNAILAVAVHSHFVPEIYADKKEWNKAVKRSPVRLQWDPDRYPDGARLHRKAIQLGLRGDFSTKYAKDWIIDIEDISTFVREQFRYVESQDWHNLLVPKESIYPVAALEIGQNLGLGENPTIY